MSTQKVAVITGASQGIGAGLVDAYRKLGYAVVATSRTIAPSDDPDVLDRPGRHRRPGHRRTGDRRRRRAVRPDRHPGQQRRASSSPSRSPTTPTRTYATVTGVNLAGFFRHHPARRRRTCSPRAAGTSSTSPPAWSTTPTPTCPSVLASLTKGGLQSATKSLAIEYATRGIRVNAVSPGHHQDPDAPRRDPRVPRRPAPGRPDGRDRATSSTRSSTWRPPRSSPARSCTSTAARAPATEQPGDGSPRTALGVSAPILAAPMARRPQHARAGHRRGSGERPRVPRRRLQDRPTRWPSRSPRSAPRASASASTCSRPTPCRSTPTRSAATPVPSRRRPGRYGVDVLSAGHRRGRRPLARQDRPVAVRPGAGRQLHLRHTEAAVIAALRAAGTLVVQTVTSPAEARQAAEAGADLLAVQASAAGGHSGTLTPRTCRPVPLADLVDRYAQAVSPPLVAAGGLATPADVTGGAARRSHGGHGRHRPAARGRGRHVNTPPGRTGRPGRDPHRGDPGVHRPSGKGAAQRLHRPVHRPRAGRLSRPAPPDRPLRRAAAAADDPERINLWAGTGYRHATAEPAAQILHGLIP